MKQYGSKARVVFDWYDSLVFALAVVMIVLVFGVRITEVFGHSMEPTLQWGDRVAVQILGYKPERGDIVVTDSLTKYGETLIKRIIATEGDTVDIDFESGAVTVNGQQLEEPYISGPTYLRYDVEFPVTVPEGCVFVMGDNRSYSLDSRSTDVGFIDEKAIFGKVLLRLAPLGSFGKVL